jgi:hypothetical protein
MKALEREIGAAVDAYAAMIAAERVTVDTGPVTAGLGLDGALHDLTIDPRTLARCAPDELAAHITRAIRAAESAAERRRAELAEKVTFLGHPVLEVVREMINDPEAAARRLTVDAQRR